MTQKISALALLVHDYDEAIAYYTEILGFVLLEDTRLNEEKRWVRVAPKGSETALLLAKASTSEQETFIGNQSGGRVFLFLQTDDFWRDYRAYKVRGVDFREEPREETYGTVAVFEDIYGNVWDLVQLRA